MTADDVYPMPLFPRLTVRDVAASTAFYADVLGFEEIFAMPGGGMSHVRYRKYADVMLVESGESPPENVGRGVELSLTVEDGSVDEVADRVREAGRDAVGPTETAWNTREVRVEDPDGYVLVFSERVEDPDPLPWLEEGAGVGPDGTPDEGESAEASDGEAESRTDSD